MINAYIFITVGTSCKPFSGSADVVLFRNNENTDMVFLKLKIVVKYFSVVI